MFLFLDELSRRLAKGLVEECEKALAPSERHCFSDAFAPIDDFAGEMKSLHSRLQAKLKVATNDGKLSLLKASEEKGILESKLKVVSDELLVVSTNYEKLQNDNMQLQTERDAAKIDSNILMTESVRLCTEKTSLEKEISRMQTDFEEKLRKASEEKDQLESKLNEQLLEQLDKEKHFVRAEYDLELVKASDEKGQLESKLSLVETNLKKLENEKMILVEELKKVSAERNALTRKEEQLLEQSEIEARRMRTEFEEKVRAIKQKVSQTKVIQLNSRTEFENMKMDFDVVKNDLMVAEAKFEELPIEKIVSEKAEKGHAMELKIKELNDRLNMTKVELKKISSENDNLLIERIQFQNEKKSLENELAKVSKHGNNGSSLTTGKNPILEQSENEKRMNAEFQLKLHAVVQDVNRLKLRSRPVFDKMKNSFDDLNSALLVVKANFEKLQNEAMVLGETNQKLRFELENVESNLLKLEKDHILLQADFNMEKSMAKIQIEAMKLSSTSEVQHASELDAQINRLNHEKTTLEQKVDELKRTIEQSGIGGLISRIQVLEEECGNLKKERDTYRSRWKYVKSKHQIQNTSVTDESECMC